jgi:tetratricopeptide (TPR) repeat protein
MNPRDSIRTGITIGQAQELCLRGKYSDAKSRYDAVIVGINLDTDFIAEIGWYLYQQRGVCKARLHEHIAAIDDYSRALHLLDAHSNSERDLKSGKILRDRADSYSALGMFDEAFTDLQESTKLLYFVPSEDLTVNYHFMGRLERRRGNIDNEGEFLQKAYQAILVGRGKEDKLYLYLDYASWLVRTSSTLQARKISASALWQSLQIRSLPHIVRSLQLLVFAKHPDKIHRALYGRN